jgi:cytochrome c oxidase cbb3-type subunit 3
MSDFYSSFWDYYVAIIVIVSIVGCGLFLFLQTKQTVSVAAGQEASTGNHVWDGDLREYHNPMPRWWIILFYVTVAFGLAYVYLYPALGTQYKGSLGWTQNKQLADEVKVADAVYGPKFAKYAAMPLDKIAGDTTALGMGDHIFQNHCAQCHGGDGRGAKGFPNLADNVWYWGGTPEAIEESISKGRVAAMPPMAAAVGGTDDVADVAHYVLSLSNSAHDPARAARGKEKFAVCAACHGPDGKGMPALGSRDLTVKGSFLYGQTVPGIIETIVKGRAGVMPAQKGILTDPEIHIVAGYVMSLITQAPAKKK